MAEEPSNASDGTDDGNIKQGQEGGMRRPDTSPEEGESSRDEAGEGGEDQRGGDKRQEREDTEEHESEAKIEKEGKAEKNDGAR